MKTCPTCGVEKPLTDFPWKYKSKGQRQCQCRVCMRAYVRDHYLRNIDYYVEKSRKRRQRYWKATYPKVFEYLKDHPCVDCGESNPIVLEFDHVDRASKVAAVSEMIRLQRPWQAILDEIAKCDVRCANCHRRRTAAQEGWFSYLSDPEDEA